ncbi:sigma-70 family RNA polymerase sigma factor [Streptomyces antibioticus]|uniref:sigma-70 family RNA polymerase sigma factor n=1 Tax=Streptomyces antibioticus TaxID=1890 RepID=UPI000B30BCAA|nr:sigma-70 family RNA polymerase sigma factor [Streptomyces antibioticus]
MRQVPGTGALTEEQAGRILADINEVIRAGEEMRRLRGELIQVLVGLGWTQETIARLAGMSQPAVSKQLAARGRTEDAPEPTTPRLDLDQRDTPWLEGRLWAVAEEITETLDGTARCTRYVAALERGRRRFTPENVDELRRLVEDDLRLRRAELPDGLRAAYDGISRALDLPAEATGTAATPARTSGSASVRRALARRLQRDRLRDDRSAL